MYKISLEHITHSYGDKKVLDNFSFSFEEAKTTCMIGPSGCGKTTILRLIAGLEVPQKGIIGIGDSVATENQKIHLPPHKRRIGFVFQDLALWPHFTVFRNIAFGAKDRKEAKASHQVDQILDLFGLADKAKKYPHQLSGGQKQMVAIARSLVHQPEIFLMDEPLANIDVMVKEKILAHIKHLQQQLGFTMLYVTHDHQEAMQTGDTIMVMNEGVIEASGTREQLANSTNQFIRSFLKL
jgi:ABC-type Fe3+/spermidine/putrescine transport system ATPase subunit